MCGLSAMSMSEGRGSEIWVFADRLMADQNLSQRIDQRLTEAMGQIFSGEYFNPQGLYPGEQSNRAKIAIAVAALAGELAVEYQVVPGVQGGPTAAIKYCLGLKGSKRKGASA